MARGKFLVFEGIDGSGKTAHATYLAGLMVQKGLKVHLTTEPSQGSVGKFLRFALRDGNLDPHADALLFAADRTDHTLKEIIPKIDEGYHVVSDRYLLSTVCYQAAKSDVDPQWIFAINCKAVEPDLTIILDVDPRIAMGRIADRMVKEKFESVQFLDAVRANYRMYVKPPKIIMVDSSGLVEGTFSKICALCEKVLGQRLL